MTESQHDILEIDYNPHEKKPNSKNDLEKIEISSWDPIKKVIELLEINEGLFFGEEHTDLVAKTFLISSMDQLKNAWIKTIYIEMVKSNKQYLIDNYYDNKDWSEVALFNYLEQTRNWIWYTPYFYFKIIETAKNAWIRIVGIDVEKPGIQRSFDNQEWVKVIQDDRKTNRWKYLVFWWSEHGNDTHYDTSFWGHKTGNSWVHVGLWIKTIDFEKSKLDKNQITSWDWIDCDYKIISNREDITLIISPDKKKTNLWYTIFLESIAKTIWNLPWWYSDDYDKELKSLFDNYINAINQYTDNFTAEHYKKLEETWDIFYKKASQKKQHPWNFRNILEQIEILRIESEM